VDSGSLLRLALTPPVEVALMVDPGCGWDEAALAPGIERLLTLAFADLAGAERLEGAQEVDLTLRLSDDATVAQLNESHRGKAGPTNVLSFAALDDDPVAARFPLRSLGDLILARETCAREAEAAGKRFQDHALHLVLHGVLHLLGHDHGDDAAAEAMESIERRILAQMGVADPYAADREDAA